MRLGLVSRRTDLVTRQAVAGAAAAVDRLESAAGGVVVRPRITAVVVDVEVIEVATFVV
jgi:hypothetical protein